MLNNNTKQTIIMKKFLSMMAAVATLFAFTACSEEEDDYRTYSVAVQLLTPDVADAPLEGVTVTARGVSGVALAAQTDEAGVATFALPEDIYNFSASHKFNADGVVYVVNYVLQKSIASADFVNANTMSLEMEPVVSQGSKQVILKELYVGGCPKDDGSGFYQYDKYVVIYNNSDQVATIPNFCISHVGPYNAHGNNQNYVDGKLFYAEEDYTPAYSFVFYMTKDLVLEPYTSATIALCGAIDHTGTYSQSVDLSEAAYVCYDPEDFDNANFHPVPSDKIASENYMPASKLGQGNAAAWSVLCPGIFIFSTGDNEPLAYTQEKANSYYMGNYEPPPNACAKIPNQWIFDAVDIWTEENESESLPRYSASIESGHVGMTNKLGYSIYRNVDKEATEALAENEGKLVYNYGLGTTTINGGISTDLSGIDAEASIANGAQIIFMDTNNSMNDFHQRKVASLKR